MKTWALIFLLTLSIGTPYAYPQDPDPHQLAYCVNHGGLKDFPMVEPHLCDADCRRSCGGGDNAPGCTTYCRPDHCHCIAECEKEPPK